MLASRYGRSWFMAALPYNYRETLLVLADYSDYGRAAEALGISRRGPWQRVSSHSI